jgi:hypothetical protein
MPEIGSVLIAERLQAAWMRSARETQIASNYRAVGIVPPISRKPASQ